MSLGSGGLTGKWRAAAESAPHRAVCADCPWWAGALSTAVARGWKRWHEEVDAPGHRASVVETRE